MRSRSYLPLLLILVAAFVMSACGSSTSAPATTTTPGGTTTPTGTTPSTNPPSAPQVLSGVFVDGPVQGVSFVSGGQTGTTDASGGFTFEGGGTVQFKVGNITLGTAPGKGLMTPVDLVKAVDPTATVADARVTQIAQFLMTCNSSPVTSTTMAIPPNAVTAAQAEVAVDLSKALVDVAAILGRIVPAKTPVTAAAAAAHIQATFTALGTASAGTFAAVDSATAPTLGMTLSVVSNAVGNAFDVTGKAVSMTGATWDLFGTMTTGGAFQASGAGTGTNPPAGMTIAGSMASATQIAATANFTLNNVAKSVAVTFEKAVAPAAAAQGKFALPADPGVTNATQIQHMAASMTIGADGRVSANLTEGEVIPLGIAAVMGARYVVFSGVVTSTGNIIAIGGGPGAGETIVSKAATGPSPVSLLTGTVTAGAASATIKTLDITGGGLSVPALSFVPATNAFVGFYLGTHSDKTVPGTTAFGVNNDGSAHGYGRFLLAVGARFPERDTLLDGTVVTGTGALAPPVGFPFAPFAGAGVASGLVITDDGGTTTFPGTFSGTIAAAGTVSGIWQQAPAPLATGTFTANIVP